MTENIQVQSRLPQVQTGTFYAAVANFQTKCFKPFAGGWASHVITRSLPLLLWCSSDSLSFSKKKKEVIFCIDG